MDYKHQHWPAYRYGPKGEAEIFEKESDVPSGWTDHPSKVGEAKAAPKPAPAPKAADDAPPAKKRGRPAKKVALDL